MRLQDIVYNGSIMIVSHTFFTEIYTHRTCIKITITMSIVITTKEIRFKKRFTQIDIIVDMQSHYHHVIQQYFQLSIRMLSYGIN